MAQEVKNPTLVSIRMVGSILGLTQWVKDPELLQGCSICQGCSLDPVLLWLSAVAQIQPLAWEFPYAIGLAPQKRKEKEKIKSKNSFKLESRVAHSSHFAINETERLLIG